MSFFFVIATKFADSARFAFGFAGLADVTAMQEKPMMGFGDDGSRDVLDELAFGLKRILTVGRETETFADTEDMGIDRHSGLIPNDRTNDVSGLATDTLQRLQVFDVIGNDAVVGRDQTLRHLNQVFGFRSRITDGFDVFKDLVCSG